MFINEKNIIEKYKTIWYVYFKYNFFFVKYKLKL